ncbi:MAG: DNA polymerase domain-containing protein [Candidatus Micrarchaeota archaeon]
MDLKNTLNINKNWIGNLNFADVISDYVYGNHNPTINKLRQIIKEIKNYIRTIQRPKRNVIRAKKIISHLEKLINASISFDEVKSINKIKSNPDIVYDISVDKTQNFVANGVISHNSYRYLIDNDLYPMKGINASQLKCCSFDIEVYFKGKGARSIDQKKDPIIIIGYMDDSGKKKTFFWNKESGNERTVIYDFAKQIQSYDPDVIIGFNSAGFDFPYIKTRARENDLDFDFSVDSSGMTIKKTGFSTKADIFGRFHLDAYDSASFLDAIGAMNLPANDLESVYAELFGKEHAGDTAGWKDFDISQMWKMWEDGGEEMKKAIKYNESDVITTFKIGKEVLPLYVELSKIVGLPPYDISRMSTSQMIEWMLTREAHRRNILALRRPDEKTVKTRMMNPIQGAFVKLPTVGLHENIVVCDFRSLYPTIIVAYNIDRTTLDCSCCKKSEQNESPMGHHFCKKRPGLIPHILKELIETRKKTKAEMKKHDKKSTAYKALHYRQWALKILANSAYGYLGYGRAKWYSREAAESVTAWARQYIHEVIDRAEKAGFEVLYADTDGVFLKLNSKKKEEASDFVEQYNKTLPKGMELEFQGFYPRGIFVSRKTGEAAKKRYALIRDDGTIEIKGFELVRRDWSKIAKRTQERVIEAVLRKGKPEDAIEEVKKVIKHLQSGKATVEEVKIFTQITRKLDSYEQMAPHVLAAKKLEKAGIKVRAGDLLEYIVVKGAGKISERSIPIQLLGDKKYDPEYYIDNQVLPPAMKILAQLGIKEDDLKHLGKQSGLGEWF